jgi:hypothetical protein
VTHDSSWIRMRSEKDVPGGSDATKAQCRLSVRNTDSGSDAPSVDVQRQLDGYATRNQKISCIHRKSIWRERELRIHRWKRKKSLCCCVSKLPITNSFRSTCGGRSEDQIHRTPVWRSTSVGMWRVKREWIHQSRQSIYAQEERQS